MKLLLTSHGLSNRSIADALFALVGKPAADTRITFIPTAMNVSTGDKGWFIDNLANIRKQGCAFVDVVDISALPRDLWLPRIESADVLFFSGGNSSHLMYWLKESGLAEMLPHLLQTRVYAGISAGSIVTGPSLALSNDDKKKSYAAHTGYRSEEALALVDFYVTPHYLTAKHPRVDDAGKAALSKRAGGVPVYLLDNHSALTVVDGMVTVVSEGEVLRV